VPAVRAHPRLLSPVKCEFKSWECPFN
jgi:hypothetical protein